MRLIEIRLLEGPNVYRLEPSVKIEVAVGRRRTWYGQRDPGAHALVRLGAAVSPQVCPPPVRDLAAWVRRLARLSGAQAGHPSGARLPVTIHRTGEPGGWVVSFPWREHERARLIAEAAWRMTERGLPPRASMRVHRSIARAVRQLRETHGAGPAWIKDLDRRIPIVSVTGTNGKSTTTRMIGHILRGAGRRVGMTTSDGVLIDERLVEPGDWTGPGGARQVLERTDVEVAVLETARGGILLRGLGYASNDVGVITNVTADHLDLQGVHTLPELAEVKAIVARVTRPSGTVVLNADDRRVAAIARQVRGRVVYFSLRDEVAARPLRRHLAAGGLAYLLADGWLLEVEGETRRPIVRADELPTALLGLARHNIANALAAAGAARALDVTIDQVADGLRDYRPTSVQAPGRLNLYRTGERVVIVDFAHNEAGLEALLDVAHGIAGGAAGRTRPVTAIIGTAGDRPDDALRAIGRIAARRADHVVIKETLHYLRGRTRASCLGELRAGIAETGRDPQGIPVFDSEPTALRAVLAERSGPQVVALMCHEDRDGVSEVLAAAGARAVIETSDLLDLLPGRQPRPYRPSFERVT